MNKFQTIQKVAEDIGLGEESIRTMLRHGNLTAHKIKGFKRVFIDIEELNNKITPVNNVKEDIEDEINLEDFCIG